MNGCVDVENRVLVQGCGEAYLFQGWVARVVRGDWWRNLRGWAARGVHQEGPEGALFVAVVPVPAEGLVVVAKVGLDMIAAVRKKEAVVIGVDGNLD